MFTQHHQFLPSGQTVPRIEPEIISGIVGERVNITCVVGTVEPELTQLVTTGSLQLDAVKLVLSDKVIFTYGPLMPADDNRPVMCSYGQSPFPTGTITVLCKLGKVCSHCCGLCLCGMYYLCMLH